MRAIVFPGQGSQQRGMGRELFNDFAEQVAVADRVLGYSIEQLCVDDPDGLLVQTQFTQPAVYVVNALSHLKLLEAGDQAPDYLAGHSLGEYNALLAAGVFDFETGLELVCKRATLMAGAPEGGMAAVIGAEAAEVVEVLAGSDCQRLEIANYNTRLQNILSGPKDEINRIEDAIRDAGFTFVALPVSGAFHSAAMTQAQAEFSEFLRAYEFNWLRIPVISNVEALPYSQVKVKSLLSLQITSPVRWFDSVRYLQANGVSVIDEVGPGNVLEGMLKKMDNERKQVS